MKFVSGTKSQINCRKEIHFRYFNQVPKGVQSIEEMLSFYQKQKKTVQNNHQSRFVSGQIRIILLISLR